MLTASIKANFKDGETLSSENLPESISLAHVALQKLKLKLPVTLYSKLPLKPRETSQARILVLQVSQRDKGWVSQRQK